MSDVLCREQNKFTGFKARRRRHRIASQPLSRDNNSTSGPRGQLSRANLLLYRTKDNVMPMSQRIEFEGTSQEIRKHSDS